MEQFVNSLLQHLDINGQQQLIGIMDNAICEIHNSGIIFQVDPLGTSKLHDPDPNVRVTEKTLLAKSVGYSFVVTSDSGMKENEVYFTIRIKNDEHYPNCIAICIQGGLEGLYQSGLFKENKSGIMDYNIIIDDNEQDISSLENNICILNNFYDVFDIRIIHKSSRTSMDGFVDKSKRKNGVFSKLFGK